MVMYNVNYLAVLVAAIASFFVGYLWYSQMMFGKAWMKMAGKKEMKKSGSMLPMMGASYITAVVMAYVVAILIQVMGATTPVGGAMVAFWAWLGFVATISLNGVLWEGKSVNWYLINAGHHLVALLVMGAILAAWP